MLRLAALALILSACNDPYGEAQKADTIAGWEAYIQDNPRSPKKAMAEIRLEELYLASAREAKSLETYDTYLTKFPKGKMVDDAKKERREFLIEWARTTDTVEAWEKYLAEYPASRSEGGKEAKRRLNMAKHKDSVELGPVKMEQVNLAEDPNGPLNGYGFYVDVTNNGDAAIAMLKLEIHYLDEAGQKVGSEAGQWLPLGCLVDCRWLKASTSPSGPARHASGNGPTETSRILGQEVQGRRHSHPVRRRVVRCVGLP